MILLVLGALGAAVIALSALGAALIAMTIPGAGGQPPRRPDQWYQGSQPVPVAPGSSSVVRARQVIISGPGESLLVYDGPPALGSLILAVVAQAGLVDSFGNDAPNPGLTSFFNAGVSGFVALNINGGALSWSTAASEGGPWTVAGEIGINISDPTNLIVDFASWTTPP